MALMQTDEIRANTHTLFFIGQAAALRPRLPGKQKQRENEERERAPLWGRGLRRRADHLDTFSSSSTGLSTLALFVSTMTPLVTISSKIKCAFSMLNIMSSSHTFSK